MVGLPDSTKQDEIKTAKDLIKLHPKMIRIYPVLVIKDTQLEKDFRSGDYIPNTLEQAVETCSILLRMFKNKKIDVIRIGLQNTDEICDPKNETSQVVAGPYHPAFRQLVESRIYYDEISEKIKSLNNKVRNIKVLVNTKHMNSFVGHKRENINRIKEIYNVNIKIIQDDDIKDYKIIEIS